MGRTIREHFEGLDEPYRSEALENMDKDMAEDIEPNVCWALDCAFLWHETEQGRDYWKGLYRNLLTK